jgi:alpha-tubulin suppressor-like RCC1 family protein
MFVTIITSYNYTNIYLFENRGSNQDGQLGDATTINRPVPQQVTLNIQYKNVIAVRTGYLHNAAITIDGLLFTWGRSNYGQLGDGQSSNHLVAAPTQVKDVLNNQFVVGVGANTIATYALLRDGSVYSMGGNSNAQLGDKTTTQKILPVKVFYPAGLLSVTTIYTSPMSNNVFFVSNTSDVFAIGDNSNYNFGTGSAATAVGTAVQLPKNYPNSTFTTISPGESHTLYMLSSISCYSVFADDPSVCSGHGTCVADDTCVCNSSFVEKDCSIPICYGLNASDPDVCSGHGQCLTVDTCVCYDSYKGAECDTLTYGFLYGGGDNTYGQLGDSNSGMNQLIPIVSTGLKGQNLTSISAGGYFSLALTTNGTLYSFGYGAQGQLASGSTASSSVPIKIGGLLNGVTVAGVCAGFQHSLAVDTNGTVYSWGANNYGQLGQGDSGSAVKSVPGKVQGLTNQFIVSVACGYYSSYALTINGTVFSWGQGNSGQIGDGNTNAINALPIQIYIGGLLYNKRVSKIAAGLAFTAVLASDGSVWTFGLNDRGQIGDSTTTNRVLPTLVSGIIASKKIIDISTGGSTTYCVSSDGILYAWGHSVEGELGTGSSTNSVLPVAVTNGLLASQTVVRVNGGLEKLSHALVLTANQTVFSMGYNGYGQLADGNTGNALYPLKYNLNYPNRKAVNIQAGSTHSLVLYDATLSCFGDLPDEPSVCSFHGKCIAVDVCQCDEGYNGTDCSEFSCFGVDRMDPDVCSGRGACIAADTCFCFQNMTAAGANCELDKFGLVYSLGKQDYSQFGEDEGVDSYVPVPLGGYMARKFATNIDAGNAFSWILAADGTTYHVGNSYVYYSGAGTTTTVRPYPTPYPNSPQTITSTCSGLTHLLSLNNNGQVFGWGSTMDGDISSYCYSNSICNYGNLGPYGQTVRQVTSPAIISLPVMPTDHSAVSVACGRINSAVLTNRGRIISFGYNPRGETGTGSTANYVYNPTVILGLLLPIEVIQVSLGNYHALVLGRNGQVFSYGQNGYGQLGDSTITDKGTPTPVLGALAGKVVVQVVAGVYSSYALTNEGRVYSWGFNSNGQLGLGDTTTRTTPTLVQSLVNVNVTSIASSKLNSQAYVIVTTSTGQAYSFGWNIGGNLGDSTTTQRNSPVLIPNPYPNRYIIAAAAGSSHTLLLFNGTFCFGVLADDPLVCSFRGDCTGNDQCVCEDGYLGPDCSINTCYGLNSTDSQVCSGHGSCVALNSCSCRLGFGGSHCERNITGYPMTLGRNNAGQLGDDYYNDQKLPVTMSYPLNYQKYVKFITSGADNTFVLTTDNELWAWGINSFGQLGMGDQTNRNRPVRIAPGT